MAAVMVILGLVAFIALKVSMIKAIERRLSEFEMRCEEKKAQGYDIAWAEALAEKARQAFERSDYKTANVLLDMAFSALEQAEIPFILIPRGAKEEARRELSRVHVAVFYEWVTDGIYYLNRSVDDVVHLLKEVNADFVFRGWWRWYPCPESPRSAPSFFTREEIEESARRGYTYEQLRDAVAKIHEEIPGVIFCGAVSAQRINGRERNPITGQTFEREETWAMALDPAKWNILYISKEEFQERLAKEFQWLPAGEEYDWKKADAYFPDITNPNFQELLLSWAEKQIDCGVDAIWIDLLFLQATVLKQLTNDPLHPAVQESYTAACKIVDEIHSYGYMKGKYIYVGTWLSYTDFPYPPPDVDFVTVTPEPEEIMRHKLDEKKWNDIVRLRGNITTFAFLDYGNSENFPLFIFSQRLSTEEQKELMKEMDKFFQEHGIIFVYPLHGGFIGKGAEKLAFGKYHVYDSLAPEFQTYDAIKELAAEKKH
ncbi:MAG: hypothetical protein DRN06_02420 [Thermoprotei archaeon]|nr:MAG: hypothetical protein DRN06_02420 [Thermoprotei archaeon]